MKTILDINIQGTTEHTIEQNNQLLKDLQIYKSRPFLNRQERNDMQEFWAKGSRNHIIGLLNFDKSGNYLPDAYQAPKEIIDMLYPIDDLMEFERQGTLIIDREQYSPELRKLSFFIYMVDAELYDEYKTKQNFLGSAPTFMFDKNNPNGVRVFRDYFALVRHLRNQRLVSFCIGPRTMFYIRYYLHQVHVHTVEDAYAYGNHEDATLANEVLSVLERQLAFKPKETLDYHKVVTVDNASLFRKLATVFKMRLPDIEKHEHTTHIVRYSKLSIRNKVVYKLRKNKIKQAEELGLHPWHHFIEHEGYVLAYVWDTREIQAIFTLDEFDLGTYCMVNDADNRCDLVVKYTTPKHIREIAETLSNNLAIQFRDNELILNN